MKIKILFNLSIIILLNCLIITNNLYAQNYVGSQSCQGCHNTKHTDWKKSGHPYKLQKIQNALPPSYPSGLSSTKQIGPISYTLQPGLPMPPKGHTWGTIGWVLGGYHSNARFLNTQGYLILGDTAQYNIPTKKWVTYTQSAPGTATYTYSCYKCHTTGASQTKTPEFQPYPGIEGSWVETGVGCEGCHGPASNHISNPSVNKPPKEGYNTCNGCHARDRSQTNTRVEWLPTTFQGAATGFIRHREQGDMMLASKHHTAGMTCVSCHEPHKSVYYELGGLKASVTCQTCHPNKVIPGHGNDKASCTDCHMPNAARNGDHLSKYVSEQSAHFWKILTTTESMFDNLDTSFIAGKKYIKLDGNNRSGLTLDYTCLQCHVNKDIAWAARYARNIHTVGVSVADKNQVPSAFNLSQNYPNPFNPGTKISYSLATDTKVNISVYSLAGELVSVLINENKKAGYHSVEFNGQNLPSGVYLYKIIAGNFGSTKKMLLIK